MKLLWLCNAAPGVVASHICGKERGAVNWVDHVLSDLREMGVTIRILCPGKAAAGELDEKSSYLTFPEKIHVYDPALEALFRRELQTYRPDVIHSWGTEFAHTLAMVNAAEKEGMLSHMAAGIQGLVSVCARHYTEGIPFGAVHSFTLRDFLRQDNIAQQQKKFARRGEFEEEAIRKLSHVLGRTRWDLACTKRLNPEIHYHFCGETLREPFYEGTWRYENCRKHRIFASSCAYPVKGFHYLLEAFAEVLKTYPDATLAVPGKSFLQQDFRRDSYGKYLASLVKKYDLAGKIQFLGKLSAEDMKKSYLEANVFALPSTIENSPNSLGEAMLLGVPSAAADVGGVSSMMTHEKEGFLYPSSAPYMLASFINEIFAMEERAEALGTAARTRAFHTHDPKTNLESLLSVYKILSGEGSL